LFFLFDAKEKQHFNPEDRNIIINIGDGISTFIANRLMAYDLLERNKEGKRLLSFSKELNGCTTIAQAIDVLAMEISKYFEASRLTISTVRTESGKGIIKKVIGQQDEFMENKEFVLDEGLTGWVVSKQKPYLIEDLEKGEYFIPRYSKDEKSNFGLRAFLGIPIVNEQISYGAVSLEHQLPKKYSKKDQLRVEKFVDIFSSLYARYRKQ
jgi:transcriptional regulator with GAF, ATPase, and Fis domain